MIFDQNLSSTKDVIDHKLYYLAATNDKGLLINIKNNRIEERIKIPHWSSDQKDNFKKVII